MKLFLLVFLCAAIAACDKSPAIDTPESVMAEVTTGSFRNRGGEIGAEILDEMGKQGIEYWINEDGSIGYYLADGDEIDAIVYYARGKYAARN